MQAPLTITLHDGNPREAAAERLLFRLLREHDVERWLFTREVIIRSQVQPHSHPVLTLNTRQIDDPDGFLGTFLHEQFHWAAEAKRAQVETAVEELRARAAIGRRGYYTWIYQQAPSDDGALRDLLEWHGLALSAP